MNLDVLNTSDIKSRGAPRLVLAKDLMKTVFLDSGDRVDPINGILWKYVPFAANATQVALGTQPAGTCIIDAKAFIITTFDAATTNGLSIGTAGTPTLVRAATSVGAGGTPVTGYINFLTGTGSSYTATARDLVVAYTQSGTAATQGNALVVVTYQFFPATNSG